MCMQIKCISTWSDNIWNIGDNTIIPEIWQMVTTGGLFQGFFPRWRRKEEVQQVVILMKGKAAIIRPLDIIGNISAQSCGISQKNYITLSSHENGKFPRTSVFKHLHNIKDKLMSCSQQFSYKLLYWISSRCFLPLTFSESLLTLLGTMWYRTTDILQHLLVKASRSYCTMCTITFSILPT